jgi:TetR/AcrR family transcriptional regulator
MARHGFSQTSIRDVAGKTGFSLGGMYYYFKNKEDLLFQIQEKTFAALLRIQEESMAEEGTAEERLRRLVQNHLSYFTSHFAELKICTFELESLQGERYEAIAELRRRHFRCMAGVVGELLGVAPEESVEHDAVRRKTLYIFGMLNWIFMWFDPDRDTDIALLGEEMIDLILFGLSSEPPAG